MLLKHPFHLVDPSPWPFVSSVSCFITAIGAAMFLHSFLFGSSLFFLGLLLLFSSMFVWWRDVVRESTFSGFHTLSVLCGLRSGFLLFIVSEVMFFFAFFWAFFHSSLSPSLFIGSVWPPASILPFDPFGIPLLNTFFLLSSGASVTWAHHELLSGRSLPAQLSLLLTLLFALCFSALQLFEYVHSSFSISDGIFGSTFFLATGFHGFHVFVGTLFLAVCYFRLSSLHFSTFHHFGFEAAAWYWHFVDVVWLFLFVCFYWWGLSF